MLELEHAVKELEDRIDECEKSTEIQGILLKHLEQHLERIENKNNVSMEEIVETIIPQTKPFFSLANLWFRR